VIPWFQATRLGSRRDAEAAAKGKSRAGDKNRPGSTAVRFRVPVQFRSGFPRLCGRRGFGGPVSECHAAGVCPWPCVVMVKGKEPLSQCVHASSV
jgi:hypothetical protein